MSIAVLKPGLQTTLQSRPRIGLRHYGVPASGAADPLSLALANRLVANSWDAAALEVALLGPALRLNTDCAIAVTGASFDVTLNDAAIPLHETVFAEEGDVLSVGGSAKGARCYIAFSGGLEATKVLGSSSTYLAGGLGGLQGRALQQGDELRLSPARVPGLCTPAEFRIPMSTSWALRACESFETSRLTGESRERLFESNWTVGRRADRMGLKLDGARLDVTILSNPDKSVKPTLTKMSKKFTDCNEVKPSRLSIPSLNQIPNCDRSCRLFKPEKSLIWVLFISISNALVITDNPFKFVISLPWPRIQRI